MKIGIIGAGAVASAITLSTILRGCAREIIVVSRTRSRAKAMTTDVRYGSLLSPVIDVRDGDYEDLKSSSVVLITAGVNEKAGGATDRNDPAGRLKLLEANTKAYEEIVPQIVKYAPEAVIVVVTDPPDPLADIARHVAGHNRVISTGTYLDSMRFRVHLGQKLSISASSIEALVVGEHGTSQVFLWSSARARSVPYCNLLEQCKMSPDEFRAEVEKDVRFANITIIEGNDASRYGIGMVCARIVEIILRDENAVIPIGSYNKSYGVTLSLPSVLGRYGVNRILEPDMSRDERAALERSAEKIKNALSGRLL
jgi:L-lactate dehydrogenase